MKKEPPYHRVDYFYLMVATNPMTEVHRKIAEYFKKPTPLYYVSDDGELTNNSCKAWIRKARYTIERYYRNNSGKYLTCEVVELDRRSFIELMESGVFTEDNRSNKNKVMYEQEKTYEVELKDYRQVLNLGEDYNPPDNLDSWDHCTKCGFKPLMTTNKDYTYLSCGCQGSKIVHRNNMSPVTPVMTWNYWNTKGLRLFLEE